MLTAAPGGVREKVTGSRDVGIALNGDIVTLRSELRKVVTAWARVIISQRKVAVPRRSETSSLLHFLIQHAAWLAAHQGAADFDGQITRLVDAGRQMVGTELERPVTLGVCMSPGCSDPLFAVLRDAGPTNGPPTRIWCGSGHVFPPRQWLLVADHLLRCGGSRLDLSGLRAA